MDFDSRTHPNIILADSNLFHLSAMQDFQHRIQGLLLKGNRLVSFFGSPSQNSQEIYLNAVLTDQVQGSLQMLRTCCNKNESYNSLTPQYPQFHCFERECYEQYGIRPKEHPWLKPIRYPNSLSVGLQDYPFYKLEGKEVHEVGVGPVHAGVIEPGHFRFMCYGEKVHHLEIQLGYQHRGLENILLGQDPSCLAPLIETAVGDSSIAHTWAYCLAWEALSGVKTSWEINLLRGIALELERIAMHLAGLAGMATDIAFLPGASTYARLRTTVINTTMLLSGSRFGRGWLRPGEVRFVWNPQVFEEFTASLRLIENDIKPINDLFQSSKTVRHRLKNIGQISQEIASALGVVGMVARSTGIDLDLRKGFVGEPYRKIPINHVVEFSGDCWARALLRIGEIEASLKWLSVAVAEAGKLVDDAQNSTCWKIDLKNPVPKNPVPSSTVVVLVEGWRGEVMHCLQTDENAKLLHYKIQDPSLRNWFALALAMRENDISDFPICNKSFDLSYCGHDL